jgi:acyl carrier protein phosphodiesterase
MNWLAHLRLAPPDPLLRLGNLCGDFVRGVDLSTLPPALQQGIHQHRAIDRFVDGHPLVARARGRLPAQFRRLSGVLVDVFFDHFLARDWAIHGDGRTLREFADGSYELLERHAEVLPPRLLRAVPTMRREDWLASYAELAGIDAILARMARRLSRPAGLESGGELLRASYGSLGGDFAEFWPELAAEAGRSTAGGTA